jgi:hypothetical protein
MSRLFITLYLDEDVSVLISKLIRARGYLALTTLEAGQAGRTDEEQLSFATGHQSAIPHIIATISNSSQCSTFLSVEATTESSWRFVVRLMK